MTRTVAEVNTGPGFWLRNRPFDLFFIFGIPVIAILGGSLMVYDTQKFLVIASINTMLLAQPHIISTFTRISFDRSSFKKHFFLVVPLPLIIITVVSVIAYSTGSWLLATIYLYWQWWHYTRQSYGISRMYLSQTRASYSPHPLLDNYALYALPLCGILYRSYQQPASFLGMNLYTFPIPFPAVVLTGAIACILIMMQITHWSKAYRQGTLPLPYMLYIASHYIIFTVGYLLIDNISLGWLVLSIWHNTQYMAFVWLYNNKRFHGGHDADEPFLSDISQTRMVLVYFFSCLFLAVLMNEVTKIIVTEVHPYSILPWMVILPMSINFHHYIVDAIVWKRKRRTF